MFRYVEMDEAIRAYGGFNIRAIVTGCRKDSFLGKDFGRDAESSVYYHLPESVLQYVYVVHWCKTHPVRVPSKPKTFLRKTSSVTF